MLKKLSGPLQAGPVEPVAIAATGASACSAGAMPVTVTARKPERTVPHTGVTHPAAESKTPCQWSA